MSNSLPLNTDTEMQRWADEFVYVDTTLGGLHKRNAITRWDAISLPPQPRDCFRTYLRFTDALRDYTATNRHPETGRPSVGGFSGPAWAEYMPFDFDDAADPARAIRDASAALVRWEQHWGINPASLRVFFSGCKGVSIEIPATLFGGLEPSSDVAHRLKHVATTLAAGCSTVDTSIYDTVRLWRIPNTIHGKSGLHKIPLSPTELLSADLQTIRELARRPRTLALADPEDWNAIPELRGLWDESAPKRRRKSNVAIAPPAAPHETEASQPFADHPLVDIAPVVDGCAWLRHCRDDAAVLKEPEWYAMLSILGRCHNGDKTAHTWSATHPMYSVNDTTKKLRHALASAGPRTCDQIASLGRADLCAACPSRGHIRSPIQLAGLTPGLGTSLPAIELQHRQLRDVMADAWHAIQALNEPVVFSRDGALVRVLRGGHHSTIAKVDAAAFVSILSQVANWTRGSRSVFPQQDLARSMVAMPIPQLPVLDRVISSPVYDQSGTLLTVPGYHASASALAR